jgi:SPIRAL1-like protein
MSLLPAELDRMLKNLLEKDLRIQCRARGLTPAGGKDTLRQRVKEHMLETNDFKLVDENGQEMHLASNIAGANSEAVELQNNYVRPDGQNVGNFLTDRPSSRVLAAPGGASQISLGGGLGGGVTSSLGSSQGRSSGGESPVYAEKTAGAAAPSHVNNYSRPAGSQNLGNFMTDRRSTKVHAPPGGASSITFG